MSIDLPTELWLRIAQFVPDTDLFRLASVNHLFLDLVTDRRYRQLIIDDDNPNALVQKLSRIEQEPLVAKRVRSLTVHPKAVRSACIKSGKGNKRQRAVRNPHWPAAFRTEHSVLEEDTELADRFLDSLNKLSAVEEYAVEWKHGVEYERSFCLPLLTAIWPLHASHLRSIKLDMMLSHLSDMAPMMVGADRVQELSLHFICNDARFSAWGGGPGYEARQALEHLAKFINGMEFSLQSLRLSSIGHLDFSTLYANLTCFPQLARLALLVPCDPRHVVDPTGFHSFLRTHGHIVYLAFSPQYCCYQSSLGPDMHANEQSPPGCATSEEWLSRALGGLAFRALRSLELGLNILGSGGKRALPPVPRIAAAAKNVESLGILGCIISLEDLRVLLRPFSEGTTTPRRLVLEVHVLDITLLETLADALPALHTLDLTYRWVGSSGFTNVTQFREELHGRTFTSWTALWRVILRCSRQDDQSRWPCQEAIVNCLPNVKRNLLPAVDQQ